MLFFLKSVAAAVFSKPARIVMLSAPATSPRHPCLVFWVLQPRGRYLAPFNFNSFKNSQMKAMSSIK
jgi:hypothetical protein